MHITHYEHACVCDVVDFGGMSCGDKDPLLSGVRLSLNRTASMRAPHPCACAGKRESFSRRWSPLSRVCGDYESGLQESRNRDVAVTAVSAGEAVASTCTTETVCGLESALGVSGVNEAEKCK